MGFSSDWLALREGADHSARDPALRCKAVAEARRIGGAAPVILDLGCGTGSTLRALAPHLPEASWRLVDNDPALLERAAASAHHAVPYRRDLADLDALPLDGVHLVTASALLDLVTGAWLRDLAERLAARRIAFYAALTYDGAMSWSPPADDDAAITAAFNRHQRSDKPLGRALGPDGTEAARAQFEARGYGVATAESPWRLGPADTALQGALFAGIAAAAGEAGAEGAPRWLDRRLSARAAATCRIGHLDLLAIAPQD